MNYLIIFPCLVMLSTIVLAGVSVQNHNMNKSGNNGHVFIVSQKQQQTSTAMLRKVNINPSLYRHKPAQHESLYYTLSKPEKKHAKNSTLFHKIALKTHSQTK